jgi:hypothetical protein
MVNLGNTVQRAYQGLKQRALPLVTSVGLLFSPMAAYGAGPGPLSTPTGPLPGCEVTRVDAPAYAEAGKPYQVKVRVEGRNGHQVSSVQVYFQAQGRDITGTLLPNPNMSVDGMVKVDKSPAVPSVGQTFTYQIPAGTPVGINGILVLGVTKAGATTAGSTGGVVVNSGCHSYNDANQIQHTYEVRAAGSGSPPPPPPRRTRSTPSIDECKVAETQSRKEWLRSGRNHYQPGWAPKVNETYEVPAGLSTSHQIHAGGKTLDVAVTAAFSGGLKPVSGTDFQAEVDGRVGKVILTRTAETCDGGTDTRNVTGLYNKDAGAPFVIAAGLLTAFGVVELACYDQQDTWDLVECFTPGGPGDVIVPDGDARSVGGTNTLGIRIGGSDAYLSPRGFTFTFGGKSR